MGTIVTETSRFSTHDFFHLHKVGNLNGKLGELSVEWWATDTKIYIMAGEDAGTPSGGTWWEGS